MRHAPDPRQRAFDFGTQSGGVAVLERVTGRAGGGVRKPGSERRGGPSSGRAAGGATAHWGGLAAESQVERHYADRGLSLAARRWRGRSGEIDLVFRDGPEVVFVEVKRGATHDRAIERLSRRQTARLFAAGEEFLGDEPAGSLTPARFDIALVDGCGLISVIANAFL
ncbi:YraN family protein [Palleronia rufa]|uniref:YraN family protein n=1 Tax=Palleronia rufa TaxID=1530186 RepID=UPI0009DDC79F|nr:YraN family protein [Palleronia rufa]